jgi:hypothetical protein
MGTTARRSHTSYVEPAARSRAAVVAVRLGLVLVAALIALGVAEVTVRLLPRSLSARSDPSVPDDTLWADPAAWRSPPPRAFRGDPVLGYDNAPSARADVRAAEHPGGAFRLQTDSYGLRRDAEVEVPKPPGVFRVLVLGDSQTAGYTSNDESYPGRLEQLWQAHDPRGSFEVLNAGVDGYGPQQAYLWYRERGVPLDPDLVIFAIYVGNDLSDLAFGQIDGAVIDDDAGLVSPILTPWTWAELHSSLVTLVRPPLVARVSRPLQQLGIEIGPPLPPVGLDPLIRVLRECHGCWFQSLKQALRAETHPAAIEQSYRRMELLLRVLSARVTANGARLAVLVIPTKAQVEPQDEQGAINRSARLLQLRDEELRYDDEAYARVLKAAQRVGVPTIDPLVELRREAACNRLYYRRDWHLNPDGNRALATALDEALAASGLAPGRAPGSAARRCAAAPDGL